MAKTDRVHSTPRRPASQEPADWKRATRIRIKMIARERGLSDAEISRALNCGTSAVVAFDKGPNRPTPKFNCPAGPRSMLRPTSADAPCASADRPAHDSPQKPDSPAAFLESCRA
jgi:hypothetical protein